MGVRGPKMFHVLIIIVCDSKRQVKEEICFPSGSHSTHFREWHKLRSGHFLFTVALFTVKSINVYARIHIKVQILQTVLKYGHSMFRILSFEGLVLIFLLSVRSMFLGV